MGSENLGVYTVVMEAENLWRNLDNATIDMFHKIRFYGFYNDLIIF